MSHVSASRLQQLIAERIQREGPLTFAEYMRMALYEPGYGYYVTGPVKMGWEGDYFTSTDVSALFAGCLGHQLEQFWEKLKRPAPFFVLEQGAGRGDLAAGVRAWATDEAVDFARALVYLATDISAGQDSLLPADLPRVHVLLSNELIDALPVHVVEVREGHLYEVYVDWRGGHLNELLAEPSSPEVAAYLDKARIPWRTFPAGWRAEINLEVSRWLEQAINLLLPHGFILTIDYGEKARQLYTRDRRRGTLLCYYRHSTNEHPLLRPGEQDITAHVDFSALIEKGRALGLRLHKYTTQRQWLHDCGLLTALERRRTTDFALADTCRASDQGQVALLGWYNLRQRAAILTDPSGMGNFKVLVLRR
ncbi:MAG TPA: SAM-dependent methyltransferase [Ktedonobacteraceae bacterium]|nr:SAM-dependent methyltransferase [Ktedonobacteraceae bacterium]